MSGPAEKSVAEAKYLLESLYDDSSPRDKPPTTFADRQSYEAFEQIVQNKRQRRVFDRNDSNSPDEDTKPPNPNPNFNPLNAFVASSSPPSAFSAVSLLLSGISAPINGDKSGKFPHAILPSSK